jgi:SAM-dependent methyltransferase
MDAKIAEVQRFWNSNPCQAKLSGQDDRREYFEEISRKRFGGPEWHVPQIANFGGFFGRAVLEIGCGIATDGLEFARRGARYVGVDLTVASIGLATERFQLFDVPGRFEVANAEGQLPFPDGSFDHVYSFGVIHHSPEPSRIVAEIYRLLRVGGTFTVMLYNRNSLNYYVEIMFLRRLLRWSLLPKFMPAFIAAVTGFDRWKLEGHRNVLTRRRKISKDEWISMNTDGPFCPLSRVYDRREAAVLFNAFKNLRQEIWGVNIDHWPFIRKIVPDKIVKWVGRRWGWHRIIYGERP